MLNQNEFNKYCEKLNLSSETKKLIETIRNSPPSRKVRSWQNSVSGTFPSKKMGVTIQFESHKNELPYIYELEHNPQVLEFYEQPPQIKLKYKTKNDRNTAVYHTPDLFVLEIKKAYWVECKTENNIQKLAVTQPNRFQLDDNEKWICPPGRAYAKEFGLDYIIQLDSEINWVFQRNMEFLDDYYRAKSLEISEDALKTVIKNINEEMGITLSELIEKTKQYVSVDEIYKLICSNRIFVDLKKELLVEPDETRIYSNYEYFSAYQKANSIDKASLSDYATDFTLSTNQNIEWDGNIYRVINIGNKNISLSSADKELIEMPASVFYESIKKGKIKCDSSKVADKKNDQILNILSQASEKDLEIANERYEAVIARLNNEDLPLTFNKSERTLLRLINSHKTAEAIWGNGYIGLLPQPNLGNRNEKISDEVKIIIDERIDSSYKTPQQKTINAIHSEIELICEERGFESPSFRTVRRAIEKLEKKATTLMRQGKRAAYKYEDWHWELTITTPKHGERPFHIAHLDHTELDIEIIDSKTGKVLGRVHLSLLVDAYSRRILAFCISFDKPSNRTNMMIIRECVRRHGRLPQIIVVDGGKEFGSIYFDTLLAYYQCVKKVRPPAASRNGSIVERMFGVTNKQFIHKLFGNTQIMKNVRLVTKSVNPKNLAIWNFAKLYQYLEFYFYEIYDSQIEHPALFQTPRICFVEGLEKFGRREERFIPYDEIFKIITLPLGERKEYTVSSQTGINFRYIKYFCSDFKNPLLDGKKVQIRYDPDDAGVCFAYINNRWVKCYSEHYKDFNGKSWKGVLMATEELRKKKSVAQKNKSISAVSLARFMRSVEAEELLLMQRIKERETKSVIKAVIDDKSCQVNGSVNTSIETKISEGEITTTTSTEVSSAKSSKVNRKNRKIFGRLN